MLFCLGIISAFLIRSAKENLFFTTTDGSYKYFTMTSDSARASNFYLKSKGDYSPGENYIGLDSDQYLTIGYNGRARLVKNYGTLSWWVDTFKFELTDKGTFVITKDGKCLGYEKSSKAIKLFSCDSNNSNINMIMEGGDSIAFNSHKVLHEISTADEHKFNSHSEFEHGFNDPYGSSYLDKKSRHSRSLSSTHLH